MNLRHLSSTKTGKNIISFLSFEMRPRQINQRLQDSNYYNSASPAKGNWVESSRVAVQSEWEEYFNTDIYKQYGLLLKANGKFAIRFIQKYPEYFQVFSIYSGVLLIFAPTQKLINLLLEKKIDVTTV